MALALGLRVFDGQRLPNPGEVELADNSGVGRGSGEHRSH